MRQVFQNWPSALRRSCLLTAAAGAGFLLVGLAASLALRDRMLLVISSLLALWCGLQCASLFRIVREGAYEVVEGVCVALGRPGLHRRRCVRLLQYDGNEDTLELDKRLTLRVGERYRFYFRSAPPRGWFPDFFNEGQFLALDRLGEYRFTDGGWLVE